MYQKIIKTLQVLFSTILVSALIPSVCFGANGYSAIFDGSSSQYLNISDVAQTGLDLATNFTISAWVKITKVPTDGGAWYTIASKYYNVDANRSYLFAYYFDVAKKLRLTISTDGASTQTFTTNQDLGVDVWHHVAVEYTASTHLTEFFVDGVRVSSENLGSVNTLYNNNKPFAIGAWNIGAPVDYFYGKIDDLRIYNEVIASTTLYSNYNCGLIAPLPASLVGYWQLENNTLDTTANNNDLTNTNGVTYTATDTPFVADCAAETATSTPLTLATSTFATFDSFITNYKNSLLWILGSFICLAIVKIILDFIYYIKTNI